MESSEAGSRKSKWEITIERMRGSLTKSMAKHKKNDSCSSDIDRVTKIDMLPDDVLIEIIKLLPVAQWPSLESVNRQFQRATFGAWGSLKKIRLDDDLIVDRNKIREYPVKTLDSILAKLVFRAPNVTELSGFSIFSFLMAFPMFCDASIRSLTQFDNLRSISFEHGGIRLEELTNFLETSSSRGQLRELKVVSRVLVHSDDDEGEDLLTSTFSNMSAKPPNRPQLQLEKLVLYTPQFNTFQFLATIDVSRLTTFKVVRTFISAADLISFLNRATNIANLKLNFCGDCPGNNNGLHLAQNKEILKIIGASETLLSLNFDGCFSWRCKQGRFNIDSDMVEMITKLGRRCRLEKFSLLQHLLCTEEVVSAIANNMASLKSLKLCNDYPIFVEEPLVELVTNLVRLEKLSLGKTTRYIISTAAANLTELKYFDVGIISGYGMVMMIFQDLGASVSLKELRVIIGDFGIINMAMINKWREGAGPNLEALELVPRLEGRNYATAEVINKGLRIVVKKFPGLRRLNIRGANVTDRGLLAIASSLPDLRELNLSHCTKITAKGVQGIVDGCPRLKRLEMKGHGGRIRASLKLEKYSTIYLD